MSSSPMRTALTSVGSRTPMTKTRPLRPGRRTAADWSSSKKAGIAVVRADGSELRILAQGEEPAWSPGRSADRLPAGWGPVRRRGGRGRPRALTTSVSWELSPAWSPDGRRLAFASDEGSTAFDIRIFDLRTGRTARVTADEFDDSIPAFSADGRRVLFLADKAGVQSLWSVPAAGGVPVPIVTPPLSEYPVARPRPTPLELPPDLDQQPPSDLDVRPSARGFRLWFTSAADNVGLGPLIVQGRRPASGRAMSASQRVRLSNGSLRTNPEIGIWRYNNSADHSHWHLIHFQRYELRRPGGSVVVRDRRTASASATATASPGAGSRVVPAPRFRGFCNLYEPGALDVDGGTSVGYSDRYHSRLDGQNLDLTRVPAGDYVLVNRANPQALIQELRYENNAASVRIRLSWPRGRSREPTVRVLRTCRTPTAADPKRGRECEQVGEPIGRLWVNPLPVDEERPHSQCPRAFRSSSGESPTIAACSAPTRARPGPPGRSSDAA